jgi:hypothetical protein
MLFRRVSTGIEVIPKYELENIYKEMGKNLDKKLDELYTRALQKTDDIKEVLPMLDIPKDFYKHRISEDTLENTDNLVNYSQRYQGYDKNTIMYYADIYQTQKYT